MQNIWIFQLASAPSEGDKAKMIEELDAFMAVWKAHGAPVPGEASIRYDRFVVVRATPGHASGCSIDAMNKGVSDILGNYGLTVMGADQIFFKDAAGNIDYFDFRDAKSSILTGKLNANTIVFDSSTALKSNLEEWEVPLGKTWLGRFLPQSA